MFYSLIWTQKIGQGHGGRRVSYFYQRESQPPQSGGCLSFVWILSHCCTTTLCNRSPAAILGVCYLARSDSKCSSALVTVGGGGETKNKTRNALKGISLSHHLRHYDVLHLGELSILIRQFRCRLPCHPRGSRSGDGAQDLCEDLTAEKAKDTL